MGKVHFCSRTPLLLLLTVIPIRIIFQIIHLYVRNIWNGFSTFTLVDNMYNTLHSNVHVKFYMHCACTCTRTYLISCEISTCTHTCTYSYMYIYQINGRSIRVKMLCLDLILSTCLESETSNSCQMHSAAQFTLKKFFVICALLDRSRLSAISSTSRSSITKSVQLLVVLHMLAAERQKFRYFDGYAK